MWATNKNMQAMFAPEQIGLQDMKNIKDNKIKNENNLLKMFT